MPPIPIMSTETLASCAKTRQAGAATTSAAKKTRFIMRQIRAPLTRSPKIRCLVSPPIGLLPWPLRTRAMPLPRDARNCRGSIGSVNVYSLQHHHESGRSVTADRAGNERSMIRSRFRAAANSSPLRTLPNISRSFRRPNSSSDCGRSDTPGRRT
jgi:hypothetical protein